MTYIKNLLGFILALVISSQIAKTKGQLPREEHYFVEPGLVLVGEWEGWGTSLAWWADMLGGMDQTVIKNVTDAFFSEENLNFNIVRYVIGGTTPKSVVPYVCGEYRPGAASESFRDGLDRPYNWFRDARQIRILREAIDRGANILEAFSNSPPQWMTISGCAKGHPQRFPLHDNFDPLQAPAFAEYVTEVLEHFRTDFGITFQYYAPFNEPYGLLGIGSWVGEGSGQEGCNMKRPTMVAVLREMQAALEAKGMDYVTLTGADETNINTAIETANYFATEGVASVLTKWNVHGYWDVPRFLYNRRDVLNKIAHEGRQKLWMDEMGWGSTPANDMTQAMDISRRIVADLKDMHVSAWVYWQAMESVGEWGIVSVPYRFDATLAEVQYNSGYFAMMQFSHYIKQGYQLIFVNDPNTVAAFHPSSKTLVLVIVHESSTASTKHFDLHRFSHENLAISSMTRTSAAEQHVSVLGEGSLQNGDLVATIAPASITTVVISGLQLSDPTISPLNLLVNGDFEAAPDSPDGGWTLSQEGGSLADVQLPWRGAQHGLLPLTPNSWLETGLSQSLTIVSANSSFPTGSAYLSLFASTKGADTWIEAWVEGEKVAERALHPRPGYRAYGLHFRAKTGNQVMIRVKSGGTGNGPVFLDNAMLHFVDREWVDQVENLAPQMRIGWGGGIVFASLLAILKTFCN